MGTQGGFAIVIEKEKKKLLLVKRKDGPIWDLPGGRKEKDEDIVECVVRETVEETGYSIKVLNKIGEYNRIQRNDTQHVFLAEIIGGVPIKDGNETSKIAWFPLRKLPLLMVPHRKDQVKDYIGGNYQVEKVIKDSSLIYKLMNKIKRH
jgi:8-oxo-dGTP diphosphatase